MKIIYLTHQFFPEYRTGTENFVLNNAIMSQKFGNEVKVITYSFYDNKFYTNENHGTLYKEFYYEGIPVLALKYIGNPENINLLLRNLFLYQFAETVLRNEAPDVIHIGHPMRIHDFIRAAQNLKIPYVITLTDFYFLCPKIILQPDPKTLCSGPNSGKSCLQRCPEFNPSYIESRLQEAKKILTSAKCVISPSNFSASIFKREFTDLSLRIVPHGVRFSHIKENPRIIKSGNNIIFGYLGNLAYHKGIHILLSAFKRLKNKDIYLKIFGFGQDDFVEKLKILAVDDQRISFEGPYDSNQLGNVFNQIDVLIIPSLCYETYSFVLHEAFACNVPVIGSNLGIMREELKSNRFGCTFEPGDSIDLQEKMQELITVPTKINRMKRNLKNEILVSTIEQEAYSYRSIYQNIVAQQ